MQISVIIPTYNRRKILSECLGELEGQSFSKEEFEVIVVDDASRDRTYELVGSFGHRLNIRYFRQEKNRGPAAARNVGIKEAKGEIIAFLDDDCLPDKDWLANISGIFKSAENIEIIQGGFKLFRTNSPVRKMHLASTILADEKRILRNKTIFGLDQALFFGSGNSSIRRSTLFKHDLYFDEGLITREDADLYRRIRLAGLDIIYSENVRVSHLYKAGPFSFLRRHFGYGRGGCQLRKKWQGKNYEDTPPIGKVTVKRLMARHGLLDALTIYLLFFLRKVITRSGSGYEKVAHKG